ncbi:MAG: deoxyribodipyrimidine photo-lyase [Pseudomonadota bacterium]
MSLSDIGLCWFRQDLRVADNPALTRALQQHTQVLCVYVNENPDDPDPPAACWWQQQAVRDLADQLQGNLLYRTGDVQHNLQQIIAEYAISAVYWNRLYDPASIARDKGLKTWLREQSVQVHSFSGQLFFEPWQLLKRDESPYRVFTPFYKACLAQGLPSEVLPTPDLSRLVPITDAAIQIERDSLAATWTESFSDHWNPSRQAGQDRLRDFVAQDMSAYRKARDIPANSRVSHLAPYLHFGQLSAREVVVATCDQPGADAFVRQLVWREFAHYVLYHSPHTLDQPMNAQYAHFPWRTDPDVLRAWQRGQTGIPLVDAGMRQLWQTGYLHNRLRMIVASLLCKHLLIDWRAGAAWFMYTLFDADLANNTLGWQWVAGSGVDAAPYFRIFNPVSQGERFDADGAYVRRWVPELAALPDRWIHQPWAAPAELLAAHGVQLGRDYPQPIVQLAAGRQAALAAWEQMKVSAASVD